MRRDQKKKGHISHKVRDLVSLVRQSNVKEQLDPYINVQAHVKSATHDHNEVEHQNLLGK